MIRWGAHLVAALALAWCLVVPCAARADGDFTDRPVAAFSDRASPDAAQSGGTRLNTSAVTVSGTSGVSGGPGNPAAAQVPAAVLDQIRSVLRTEPAISGQKLAEKIPALSPAAASATERTSAGPVEIFQGYVVVFVVAFLVTLIATPIMRRLAIANGVVDRPNEARKLHKFPIAYMGGVGVYLGIMAGVLFSYTAPWHGLVTFHSTQYVDSFTEVVQRVPLWILAGLTIAMITGLLDDMLNISPWQKIGGQLVAAACLAIDQIGTRVAYQVIYPVAAWLGMGGQINTDAQTWFLFALPPMDLPFFGHVVIGLDLIYWTGVGIIGIFVLGACNASNLIDGLDGLLSGVTAICVAGILIIALTLAAADAGPLDSARVVLCLAVLGACVGFLPHNFNPAVIFLGDAGSLLLGFATAAVILTLGERGRTDLVLAGLVVYSVPIIDTALAIIRRKLAGKSISDADDQHLHHMLKRALGVKGAVLTLYGIAAGFAVIGVALSMTRARVTYALALVFALFISTVAIKLARGKAWEEQALALAAREGAAAAGGAPASNGATQASVTPASGSAGSPRPATVGTPSV